MSNQPTTDDELKSTDAVVLLQRIAREMTTTRKLLGEALFAMREAEREIPEKMRRFMNYFHDVVHVKGEYVTLGLQPPKEIDLEMERNHDRARQILHDLHTDGGHFEKVRREMTTHPVQPRYDHTRQLKGPADAARQSPNQPNGLDKD